MTRRFDCVFVVEQELKQAGAKYRLVKKEHAKFYVECGGREWPYFCGGTTGTHNRSIENSRAGIRRLLKQLGLIASKQNQ